MNIEALPIKSGIKKIIIENDGITELYPPQEAAVKQGLLEGKNLVISIPTAAGKTLLAEIAALQTIMENLGKVVYLCPLRALASEKYQNFKRFQSLGVKVAITSGDYDSKDNYLPRYDIIVSTNEKFDALLRHQVRWIEDEVSLVIVDECHLLNDQHRGPTLEILLARLLLRNTQLQIIALSATVGNSDELAEWLKADLVQSDWRPVPLKEGIYYDSYVTYSDYTTRDIPFKKKEPLLNLSLDSFHSQEQLLIFTPSRRSAVATANKIGDQLDPLLSLLDKKKLAEKAMSITSNLSDPLSKQLVSCMNKGAAFHHAGLNSNQRTIIEESFKEGIIKVLCATPTLCLSHETKVWQGYEEYKITDVDHSKPVFALSDNRITLVKPLRISQISNFQPLIEISTVSGYSIKITQNHRMYIKRNNDKMIKEARKVKKTDKIATVGKLNILNHQKYCIEDFLIDNERLGPNIEIDPDFCYFIGLMLGDGYSGAEIVDTKIIYKGSPSIVNNDEEILNHCQKICNILNVRSRKSKNHYGIPYLSLGKNKWFRELLVRSGIEQKQKKHISENYTRMNLVNISALLQGLFDSDGYVNKDRSIGFSNSSKVLIKQTQKLLLRFGIVCCLREREGSRIRIHKKEYPTSPSFELLIAQKKSIIRFNKHISFRSKRKREYELKLVNRIKSNIHFISCSKCEYRIYKDLFGGRTRSHKKWGKQKIEIISLLGERGELGSRKMVEILGFSPRKNERRLNHHYELINKKKKGNISNTEWFWSLNNIGLWIYNHIKNQNDIEDFFSLSKCPICNHNLTKTVKKGWRASDFDGEIFWDKIREIKEIGIESSVFDVVLPSSPRNDHLFIANGFFVHNSAGINVPAKRVIISSVYRYSVEQGSYPIMTLEYKQMSGRAGRPQYDTEGEAILIAKQPHSVKWLMDRYILKGPEAVYSKLAAMPALRRSILGLIASKVILDVEELLNFFEKTFYGFQYEAVLLEGKIREVIDMLIVWEMIDPLDARETLRATKYGVRVSQLYLDPETAASIAEGLKIAVKIESSKIHPLAIFDFLVGTPDMVTLMFGKANQAITEKRFDKLAKRLIKSVPNKEDIEYDFRLRDFYTALFLWDWVNELPIEKLIVRYKIGAGDVHRITDTATWLTAAMSEIASIFANTYTRYLFFSKKSESLSERVKYGIKSDAVSLTTIKGIGRKRARILLDHEIRNIRQLVELNQTKLANIPGFGIELAKTILEETKKKIGSEQERLLEHSDTSDFFH